MSMPLNSSRRRSLLKSSFAATLSSAAAGCLAPLRALAQQDYPSRTIRIISPFSRGATSDLVARAIGPALGAAWGVSVVAENKPGGGVVGADLVAKSPPDGYTLLVAAAAIGVIPALLPKLPFVPYKDLQPITLVGTVPFMMLVHPSVLARTVQELVAYAKANPGKLNFSSGGNGTIPHMGGELLKLRAGIEMTHIPFKGGADSLTALLGGQVQMTIDGGPHVIGHIRSGALRMLAVATLQRLPEFPNTPTIAESGYPGFESNAWQSMWVTGGTPAPIMKKISAESCVSSAHLRWQSACVRWACSRLAARLKKPKPLSVPKRPSGEP